MAVLASAMESLIRIWTYDGRHELDGQFLMGELDWQVPDSTMILSFTTVYGKWDADIERGYTNGGIPDKSQGETDVETLSARMRIDWVDAFELLGFRFTPRTAFTYTRIETDGYTETGGGFPVRFDDMSHDSKEFRFGLTGERAVSASTTVRGIFEAVHRFDEDSGSISGEVIDVFDFSLDGADNKQTWTRFGCEASQRLGDSMLLTATIFGATEGEDPKFSGALNLQYVF